MSLLRFTIVIVLLSVLHSSFINAQDLLWTENFDIGSAGPTSTEGPTFNTSNGVWTTGGLDGDIWKHSYFTSSGEWSVNLTPFTSPTASNGFMLFDSDSVNYPLSPNYITLDGELISPSIDLTGASSVALDFYQNFRTCCSHDPSITVSVSTDDGVSWLPSHDVTSGTPVNTSYYNNQGDSFDHVINLTSDAAGETIKLKFSWLGSFSLNDSHYFWNFDDISLSTLPDDDLINLSAAFVGETNYGVYYGRTPVNQLDENYFVGSDVLNWGNNNQSNVALTANYLSSAGFVSNSSITSLLSGNTATISALEIGLLSESPVGLYEGTHTVTSNEELGGLNFDDNTLLRNFEITEYWYSQDGIGVHPEEDLSVFSAGTENWTDGDDGLVLATQYHIKQETEIASLRVMLADGTIPGGELYGAIIDSSSFIEGNIWTLWESNWHFVSEADTANGYIDLIFEGGAYLDPGNVYAAVELYSNGGENPIQILEDRTVPQPIFSSAIHFPWEGITYTNGEAFAIRMLQENCPGFSVNIIEQTNACYGLSDGTAVALAIGAPGPYSYEWSNGITNGSVSGLAPGNYTVTATAPEGCEASTSVTIYEKSEILGDLLLTNETCPELNDGTAQVVVNSGLFEPISYLWNTSETTSFISDLDAGEYSVTATGIEGCIFSTSGTINSNTVDFSLEVDANPTSGDTPLTVIFDNQTMNLGNYTFTWDFGDGTSAEDNSSFVSHTYNEGGLWDVTLTAVENSTGCINELFLPEFIFSIGDGCPEGCTDSEACNYDSEAECDDGSCLEFDECGECGGNGITGCVDSMSCNYDPAADCDDGSCLEYDQCGDCGGTGIAGCMDFEACNYSSTATCDDGSCYAYDECGDCGGAGIQGCTDSEACNYNSTATCDDGSCYYTPVVLISGANIVTAFSSESFEVMLLEEASYSWSVTGGVIEDADDGYQVSVFWAAEGLGEICVTVTNGICAPIVECQDVVIVPDGSITGCTEVEACNYNPEATTDNGNCIYVGDSCNDGNIDTINDAIQEDCECLGESFPGCTNPIACNYNSEATADDGSCFFIGDSCDDQNADTVNDTIQENCDCEGESTEIEGCMDSEACNYSPEATTDDGSCEYVPAFALVGLVSPEVFTTETYSYDDTENSEYLWSVEGGAILTGQGTSEVEILWGDLGTYSVCVIETNSEGCTGQQVCLNVVVVPTSIIEYADAEITIYPVPAREWVTISVDDSLLGLPYRIVDGKGLLVMEGRLASNKQGISIKPFSAGVYRILIQGGESHYIRSFLVE